MPMITSRHLTFSNLIPTTDNLDGKSRHHVTKYIVEKEEHFPLFSRENAYAVSGLKEKEWVVKQLHDSRESSSEAVCGEMYRYFIGGTQPKSRTLPDGNVASAYVNYQSTCDFFLNRLSQKEQNEFVSNFRNDLGGFVKILVTSIFFEENDLHDGNFGLDKATGKFIKIDHGQSLNFNRTHRPFLEKGSRFLKRIRDNLVRASPMKFWSKPAAESFLEKHQNPTLQKKLNRKTDRETLGLGLCTRSYQMKAGFIQNLFQNYFNQTYTIKTMKKFGYTASASPLFDQRFVVFGLLQPSDLPKLDYYKYLAIAQLILTPNSFYEHIVDHAADFSQNPHLPLELKKRIFERKQCLIEAMSQDHKFLQFLAAQENVFQVRSSIQESILRMQSNKSGTISKRYGDYLNAANQGKELNLLFDKKALNFFKLF